MIILIHLVYMSNNEIIKFFAFLNPIIENSGSNEYSIENTPENYAFLLMVAQLTINCNSLD